ncbi:MAG: chemotaxis protein CheW [Bacteriovoracaceae bacterium]|nr:chemotaxis protein CheW [Bacteriovoracaceae bacterium]
MNNLSSMEVSEKKIRDINQYKFLVFYVGGVQYGAPLLTVREVLEYQQPKPMPNMVNYFVGVINVRGAIVGVVDLRSKFGCQEKFDKKTAMLLCDTDKGAIAAIVDYVDSVVHLKQEDVDHHPPVQSKIGHEYLLGVAKNKDSLITIVDLFKSLCDEKLKIA